MVRRNDRFNTVIQQIIGEICFQAAAIYDQPLKIAPFQQTLCLGDVMSLICGEAKTKWVPQAIHRHMDLGGEFPSAVFQSLLTVIFLSSCIRMSANNHSICHICIVSKVLKYLFSHAFVTPLVKALKYTVPVTQVARQ